MKLLIEISEEVYNKAKETHDVMCDSVWLGIKYGTPLPKGHGRLIDVDRTLAKAWANFYKHEDEWEKKDNDYLLIGRFYDQKGFECCQQTIVNAPTIIEADRAERSTE